MKSTIFKMAAGVLVFTLLSFTPRFGGEGFEVFLNNKLVIQQFGKDLTNVKSLELSATPANDVLMVKYYQCGQIGKKRTIAIRDEQNRLLKQWKFEDADHSKATMVVRLNEIPGIDKKNAGAQQNIYYSSEEIPAGRQLAMLKVGESSTATAVTR